MKFKVAFNKKDNNDTKEFYDWRYRNKENRNYR